jgi:hypothetical protein
VFVGLTASLVGHEGAGYSHVRPLGDTARRLLEQAIAHSSSVAAMVQELDHSDVVVYVETRTLPRPIHGYVQIAGSTPRVRYLRLVVAVPDCDGALLTVLGHELRHALEIAAMPDVRDASTLAAKYRQLGVPMVSDGYYETPAALEAGRQVAREIAQARRRAALGGR